MTAYNPVQSERLYEQIVGQIEQQILTGLLKVGDRLPPERELAEQFRVSRTAVREAVKTLREKGLIEVQPGRGTFVTDGMTRAATQSLGRLMRLGSMDSFQDLVELRSIIEPEMAALAATRITSGHMAALQQAVATMDAALHDMNAYLAADDEYHQIIAQATQNKLVCSLLDPIVGHLHEQRKKIFVTGLGGPEHAQFHHKRILEALARRDPEAARQAMKDHLKQVAEDIQVADAQKARA
ncbi:MAG: FadR family transcriptional regulator [Chloroflexi bacterium]|nr:FadR family transcriptional regulator [Chloroflexota bacterium]